MTGVHRVGFVGGHGRVVTSVASVGPVMVEAVVDAPGEAVVVSHVVSHLAHAVSCSLHPRVKLLVHVKNVGNENSGLHFLSIQLLHFFLNLDCLYSNLFSGSEIFFHQDGSWWNYPRPRPNCTLTCEAARAATGGRDS